MEILAEKVKGKLVDVLWGKAQQFKSPLYYDLFLKHTSNNDSRRREAETARKKLGTAKGRFRGGDEELGSKDGELRIGILVKLSNTRGSSCELYGEGVKIKSIWDLSKPVTLLMSEWSSLRSVYYVSSAEVQSGNDFPRDYRILKGSI